MNIEDRFEVRSVHTEKARTPTAEPNQRKKQDWGISDEDGPYIEKLAMFHYI